MSGHVKDAMSTEAPATPADSPIKLFGQAKTKITDIFVEVNNYVRDSSAFLSGTDSKDIVLPNHTELVQSYVSKVSGIIDILQRNCMKVVFFGRTSNGKSTVINAMLKNKILPSGIGHTTNCFVQVEGTDLMDAHLVTEAEPEVKQNIQSVSHLAHALSKMRLSNDSLIRISWPNDRCRLLREDVIFVDSPGIDVSPDMDCWIEKFCLDADVFVLVVNAESTLMQTEKNFFHRVASRLSKPNIFILNNRWDSSATEPDTITEVRNQHLERCVSFLANELNVLDQSEAKERVFFVSALEVLDRCPANRSPSRQQLLDGWESRVEEFAAFERKFEECISRSALITKFAQHATNASIIAQDLRKLWEEIYSTGSENRASQQAQLAEMQSRLEYVGSQQKALLLDLEDDVKLAVKDVYEKMFSALTDEINRLSRVLEEFDRPFDTDATARQIYKKELHFHVEECLCRNLHVRCSGFVHNVLRSTNQHMHDSISGLLAHATDTVKPLPTSSSSDFEMSYHLDCCHLLSEFEEDIEFHFSLGITALARRFLGARGARRRLSGFTEIPQCLSPSGDENVPTAESDTDSLVAILSSFTSIYSGTTVGSLAIVAVVTKSVGWKLLMACAAAYCLLYIYERVTWTAKAKQEAFRKQYIAYAASQLSLIVGIATENCSSQVERELVSTFDVLQHQIDLAKGEMQEKLEKLHETKNRLDRVVETADKMRSRADAIDTQMTEFAQQFLKPAT